MFDSLVDLLKPILIQFVDLAEIRARTRTRFQAVMALTSSERAVGRTAQDIFELVCEMESRVYEEAREEMTRYEDAIRK